MNKLARQKIHALGHDNHISEPVMIRSLIGIVCAFVFITTCIQSTAAQAWGNYSPAALLDRAAQSQLAGWIELADQGISERILSSDAYHDDFRFRAAPVKQSRNWKMPIVDVRPAKNVSNAVAVNGAVSYTHLTLPTTPYV